MKRRLLRDALWAIKVANDWYAGDPDIEGLGHELAHSLVIGRGRIVRHFETVIEDMKPGHRNRHEAITMSVQLAALDRLGFHQSLRSAAAGIETSLNSLEREDRNAFPTRASIYRFLQSYRPSPIIVDSFVRHVHFAARIVGR